MRNGYLRYFVVSTYLDNDAQNQSLLCTDIMRRRLALEIVTLYQGENFAVSRAGICIQKLLFCVQQTLFTL